MSAIIMSNVLPGCSCIGNYERAAHGEIWVLFNDSVNISVYSSSSQALHCHVYFKVIKRYLFLSIMYVSNDYTEKELWREFENLQSSMPVSS